RRSAGSGADQVSRQHANVEIDAVVEMKQDVLHAGGDADRAGRVKGRRRKQGDDQQASHDAADASSVPGVRFRRVFGCLTAGERTGTALKPVPTYGRGITAAWLPETSRLQNFPETSPPGVRRS